MKEKTLIEMKNKLDAMTRVMQQVINEISHVNIFVSMMNLKL